MMLPKYKEIAELLKKGATLEAQEKIIELRETAIDLQEENQTLKVKIQQLQEKLDKKEALIWEKPFYWLENKDGPFCQKYFDDQQKLIRLQGGDNDQWFCYVCKTEYHGTNYKYEPSIQVVKSRRSWMEGY